MVSGCMVRACSSVDGRSKVYRELGIFMASEDARLQKVLSFPSITEAFWKCHHSQYISQLPSATWICCRGKNKLSLQLVLVAALSREALARVGSTQLLVQGLCKGCAGYQSLLNRSSPKSNASGAATSYNSVRVALIQSSLH
ncbi:uncharacterized protein LOC104452406 isoform X2 [Eucalyptus grandis]|uniref:uncharacterized protein LOC104452406 isoform X2 n=1 Tax=Eucalyptus grandis TaxID=71139 RepID=UPI00192EFF6F|nr:uncharacterized protein LOC104452406 isoform X2 [Eucalyptus grandis]